MLQNKCHRHAGNTDTSIYHKDFDQNRATPKTEIQTHIAGNVGVTLHLEKIDLVEMLSRGEGSPIPPRTKMAGGGEGSGEGGRVVVAVLEVRMVRGGRRGRMSPSPRPCPP